MVVLMDGIYIVNIELTVIDMYLVEMDFERSMSFTEISKAVGWGAFKQIAVGDGTQRFCKY
jgi:hypothetical protein